MLGFVNLFNGIDSFISAWGEMKLSDPDAFSR
jgi:hypothetical protein